MEDDTGPSPMTRWDDVSFTNRDVDQVSGSIEVSFGLRVGAALAPSGPPGNPGMPSPQSRVRKRIRPDRPGSRRLCGVAGEVAQPPMAHETVAGPDELLVKYSWIANAGT